jgi:hypothetical protein
MTKTFPKCRICVIDIYPSFERGLKTAINFASKHNVQLNSADGRRIIMSYCIKAIEADYRNTQSPYIKVICISKKAISKRVSLFFDNYFEGVLNEMPLPYCGKIDLNSPDLEFAAENSLKRPISFRKFGNLVSRLKLKGPWPFKV